MNVKLVLLLVAYVYTTYAQNNGQGPPTKTRKGSRPTRRPLPPIGPRPRPPYCAAVRCARPLCNNPIRRPRQCCSTCPPLPPNCAAVLCAQPLCRNPITPVGQCCPVCPTPPPPVVCEHGRGGDCGGFAGKQCAPGYTCTYPTDSILGTCCRNNPVCVYQGQKYDFGDRIPIPNDCCHCGGGGRIFCVDVACQAVTCANPVTPRGQCCPQCPLRPECVYNGQRYKEGDTFKDGCNTCTCRSGSVSCTEMACQCVYKGQVYKESDSFKDGCNTCTCRSGSVSCTEMACPPVDPCAAVRCAELTCKYYHIPVGQCCPVCDSGCTYYGVFYEEGDSVKTNDPCDECKCQQGQVNCYQKSCKPVYCDESYTKQGDCCPSCPDNSSY